ncbi:MAG: hypothetical protein Q4G63_13160, partial [Bacteroidia bacterium]|nr:hypothetical protein [Bacteroidia bacterium]
EWSATINWHTAYTWIANDLSFIGVIIWMFLLGMLFSILVKLSLDNSKVAIILFSLIVQIIIFLPMNNVVLSNPLTFMPLIIYLMVFLVTNKFSVVINKGEIGL